MPLHAKCERSSIFSFTTISELDEKRKMASILAFPDLEVGSPSPGANPGQRQSRIS